MIVRPARSSPSTASSGPAVRRQPGADHRRVAAGREGRRRRGVRRHHQRPRRADGGGDAPPRRHHAGADRPPGRGGAGQARAAAAVHRSLRGVVRRRSSCSPCSVDGPPLVDPRLPFDAWLYRALVLLVVACPCALVISTPVSIVSALAGAARQGVLVKGGIHLERLAGVRVVAFDKTGTRHHRPADARCGAPLGGTLADELLSVAASVESQSEHPIATAILATRGPAVSPSGPDRRACAARVGRGGRGGRRAVVCGTPRLFTIARLADAAPPRWRSVVASAACRRSSSFATASRSASSASGPAKAGCRPRGVDLRAQGVSRVAMLTGDHDAAARATGVAVGVDDVRSAQLPADKVSAVEELRRARRRGDGRRRRQRRAGACRRRCRHRDGRDGQRRRARDRRHRADDRRIAEGALHDSPEPRDAGEHPRQRRDVDRAQAGVRDSCRRRAWRRCGWRCSPIPARRRWSWPTRCGCGSSSRAQR